MISFLKFHLQSEQNTTSSTIRLQQKTRSSIHIFWHCQFSDSNVLPRCNQVYSQTSSTHETSISVLQSRAKHQYMFHSCIFEIPSRIWAVYKPIHNTVATKPDQVFTYSGNVISFRRMYQIFLSPPRCISVQEQTHVDKARSNASSSHSFSSWRCMLFRQLTATIRGSIRLSLPVFSTSFNAR